MCVLQIDGGRALVVLLATEGNGATGHKGRNGKVTVQNWYAVSVRQLIAAIHIHRRHVDVLNV